MAQRSSESIGAIAAALAKAQSELANPEKAMVATIPSADPRERDRTFHYASLSAGLDIVRKALGKQEIAVIQTTAIDADAPWIRLTTVLAHSSGEWLSSEWPVCAVNELAFPRRMGAALTYARRYALFALVAIAGEDDLDAPDLAFGASGAEESATGDYVAAGDYDPLRRMPPPTSEGRPNVRAHPSAGAFKRATSSSATAFWSLLAPQASARLRDRLLRELSGVASADEAALWAQSTMRAKNSLQSADAQQIELAFAAKVASLTDGVDSAAAPLRASDQPINGQEAQASARLPVSAIVPKRPVSPKPIRLRDKDHRRFITLQPCLVCGRSPSEPHHLRYMQPRALGRKVSDEYTVPLCRLHHRELHRNGDEKAWWRSISIDPAPIALDLWQGSRGERTQVAERMYDASPTL